MDGNGRVRISTFRLGGHVDDDDAGGGRRQGSLLRLELLLRQAVRLIKLLMPVELVSCLGR